MRLGLLDPFIVTDFLPNNIRHILGICDIHPKRAIPIARCAPGLFDLFDAMPFLPRVLRAARFPFYPNPNAPMLIEFFLLFRHISSLARNAL
jgi:hypothetical protein